MSIELPPDEHDRLRALSALGLLDTPAEEGFDEIARFAAELCGTPIALVSLVDERRQWFKARVGLEVHETPREISFCTHAVASGARLLVEDATQDPRFADNPLVCGEPGIRFYAGIPLVLEEGPVLGTLCVIDREPRRLSDAQLRALELLARQVMARIELRRKVAELERLGGALRARMHQQEALAALGLAAAESADAADLLGVVSRALVDAVGEAASHGLLADGLQAFSRRSLPQLREGLSGAADPDADASFVQAIAHIVRATLERFAAYERLAESDRRMRDAQRIAGLGSWRVDLPGGRRHWSEEVFRIFGLDPARTEPSFEVLLERVHPGDRARARAAHAATLGEGVPMDYQHRIVRPDGTVRHVRARALLQRDAFGVPVAMQGTILDITELRQAELAVEAKSELLRIAGRIAKVGGWAFDPWNDRLEWSDEVCLIHEVPVGTVPTPEEALGFYVGGGREVVREAMRACVESGRTFELELQIETARGQRKWVRAMGAAHRGTDGRVERLQGACQDITERKRTLEALRASEERYQLGTEASAAILWDWNVATDALELSQRAREQLAGAEPPGTMCAFEALVHPDDRDGLRQAVTAHLEARVRTPWQAEFRLGTDGDFRWCRANGLGVWSPEGTPLRMVGSIVDVHERVVLSEARRRLTERLQATLESITDAFFTLDPEWRFSYVNREAEVLLDRPAAALLGRVVWEEFPDAVGRKFEVEYRRAVREGRPVSFEEHYPALKTWFDVRAFPSSEGLAVYFRDITARRAYEEKIRRQAQLLDKANDAILVTGLDRRIAYWNAACERLYGWPAGAALGRRFDELLLEPGSTLCDDLRVKLLEAGEHSARIRQRCADGGVVVVEARWTLMRDEEGRPESVMAINTDVTERMALEEQLREAQRLESMGQLTGGVAHDFNNLLTVILGNAELLGEELSGDRRLGLLAEMIASAAHRGAELTQRLLAFARRQALEPQVVDVNRLLGGMEGLLQRTLGEDIEIELTRGAGLWPALVDPSQLEGALLNLCINARDAMVGGGKLTIETANERIDGEYAQQHVEVEPGEYVRVSVSDTGTGIEAEDLPRVFEPFFTTKEKGKGTGLGLSMVYGFVKQSRGHVGIYSEPGQGTVVKMYLPRSQGEVAQARQDGEGASQAGTETILLVEDDELVRRYGQEQLEAMGYRVLVAGSGPEALERLTGGQEIDLLFTDVVMPGGMSGRDLAERAVKLRPGLKVLYTSGYAENAIVHHGRLDPGVELLGKPYRRAELARKIRRAIGSGGRTASDAETEQC